MNRDKKVIVIPCSGIGKPVGTVSRETAYDTGIDDIGVIKEKGFIKVDLHLRTSIPSIYAIGDVIGGYLLAHVASKEGKVNLKI